LTHAELRSLALAVLAAFIAILLLSACETTTSTRALPAYEAPLVKKDFQNVRTTAYTHTEADHTQYGSRNALGGELHAAGPAIHRAENVRRSGAISDSDDVDVINISNTDAKLSWASILPAARDQKWNVFHIDAVLRLVDDHLAGSNMLIEESTEFDRPK